MSNKGEREMITVNRKPFWMGAEPNWDLMAREYGGLPNPGYDAYVRTYCDLETRATVCVTVGDGVDTMFGGAVEYTDGEGPDLWSWCGYQWDDDGTCWELEYGPEANYHWWEIDDLLWGAFDESYLWAVDEDTHCVKSGARMISEISQMRYGDPAGVAAGALAYWA
jgi:hypothetical protein